MLKPVLSWNILSRQKSTENLRFLWKLGRNVKFSFWDPQKAHPCMKRRLLTFWSSKLAQRPGVGSWKNPKKLAEWTFDRQHCISGGKILESDCNAILHWVDVQDIVTPANFGSHGRGVFRWQGVEFQVFPLTFNGVLITLCHYHASVLC